MFATFGYLITGESADGMVVELAQREPLALRNTTQFGYVVTGFAFNDKESASRRIFLVPVFRQKKHEHGNVAGAGDLAYCDTTQQRAQ